jgi:hypothetical protein
MQTKEDIRITRELVADLVRLREHCDNAARIPESDRRKFKGSDRRQPDTAPYNGPDRRRSVKGDRRSLTKGDRRRLPARWPFAGMVEFSFFDGDGRTVWLADCFNLNLRGLGLVTDHPFAVGAVIDLACHLPNVTMYGQAVVRHCIKLQQNYKIGVEFVFDDKA